MLKCWVSGTESRRFWKLGRLRRFI